MKFEYRGIEDNSNGSNRIVGNQIEALKILSETLLREVEALKTNTKSKAELDDEVLKGKIDLDEEVKNYEVELIRCALIRAGGKQRRAARLLNVKISTLNAKIKRYGIDWYGIAGNI